MMKHSRVFDCPEMVCLCIIEIRLNIWVDIMTRAKKKPTTVLPIILAATFLFGYCAPEEIGAADKADITQAQVSDYIDAMPLEDKVAQLFYVAPETITGVSTVTAAGNTTKQALEDNPVGGILYFGANIVSRNQLMSMISNTKSYSKYPIFIGTDEEGGTVKRIAGSAIEAEDSLVKDVGTMKSVGATGDASKAYDAGQTIGCYMHELGFNMDFAPVAGVLTDPENKTIGTRSFGSDPALDAAMVAQFTDGLHAEDVLSCEKHFPGLGDTNVDTHTGEATTQRSLDDMRTTDFISFGGGIDAGTDFVMVGHVSCPNVTGNNSPASLSEKMISGIVITDSLQMGAVTQYYSSGEAAIKTIQAGADMLLMPEDYHEAYEAVLNAINDGTISEERIDESLKRIYKVKLKLK
jgi:beta-N-acetylhexosaminidase